RVARYFGREATVLHPAVETGRFAPGPVGDAYVVLSELMPHKRIDVAIRAVNALADGGVRETVLEGETGTFYATSDPAALAEAVVRFDALAVDPGACVENAARF